MREWLCPIHCLIHPIGRKFLHFEKKTRLMNDGIRTMDMKRNQWKESFIWSVYFQTFIAHYPIFSEWNPFCPNNSKSCTSEYISGVGGELKSPGYPKPYGANLDQTWMIKVDPGEHILINFLDLDMGNNGNLIVTFFEMLLSFASFVE